MPSSVSVSIRRARRPRRTAYEPAGGTPGGRRSETSPSSDILRRERRGFPGDFFPSERTTENDVFSRPTSARGKLRRIAPPAARLRLAIAGPTPRSVAREHDRLCDRNRARLRGRTGRRTRSRGELQPRARKVALEAQGRQERRDEQEGEKRERHGDARPAREEPRVGGGRRSGTRWKKERGAHFQAEPARGLDPLAVVRRSEKRLLEEAPLAVAQVSEDIVGHEGILLGLDSVQQRVVAKIGLFEASACRVGHAAKEVVTDLRGSGRRSAHEGRSGSGGGVPLPRAALSLSMRFFSSRFAR